MMGHRPDKTNRSGSTSHYLASLSYEGKAKRRRKQAAMQRALDLAAGPTENLRNVLVIGPGSDIELELLSAVAARGDCLTVTVVDASVAVLDSLACRRFPNLTVDYRLADATALPVADGDADFIFASSLLHEVYSYRGGFTGVRLALGEVVRSLRPGGHAFVHDFVSPGNGTSTVRLLSAESTAFWQPFWKSFRHHRFRHDLTPVWRTGEARVPSRHSAEFALHLAVKLLYDPDHVEMASWKEIDEHYAAFGPAYVSRVVRGQGAATQALDFQSEPEQAALCDEHLEVVDQATGSVQTGETLTRRYNLLVVKPSRE